jgi:3-hydroxyisobutyrate dehydrogenase
MANIGFVGLGHMGLPMALNLIKAGHRVTGFDLQAQAVETLAAAGGLAGKTLADAAHNQDILITMLQTGQQVQQVCLGDKGLFSLAKAQSLYIDCSSIEVKSSQLLHQQATLSKLLVVDAPVSGGVAGAAAASLTFMVGGEKEAFEQAKPILSQMGKKIIHTGSAGSGQAAKICNNMILGISMIAISEAFILAEQLGLSAQKLFEVVSASSGQCWAMSQYAPVPGVLPNVPANRDYQPGFTAAMMLKDLLLSQKAADIETPMASQATALYQQMNDEGQSNLDFSAIIQLLAKGQSSHE